MPAPPTRSFTARHRGLVLDLITDVSIAAAFEPSNVSAPPQTKKYIGLWDTGATCTVISEKVVKECGLKPIGIAEVRHTGGTAKTNVYFISIALPNKVGIPQLRVVEGKLVGDADVLVGMDIICCGDFAVSHKDGNTAFSFRMPSVEDIDFVRQEPKLVVPFKRPVGKVGRNAPCPCGSGKKYKRCCGK